MTEPSGSSKRASTSSVERAFLRVERDKERLEQHYQDAMSFLKRAEKGSDLVEEQEIESDTVDRLQLKKYAREAMSFLDKAFAEDASILVEDGNEENITDKTSNGVPPKANDGSVVIETDYKKEHIGTEILSIAKVGQTGDENRTSFNEYYIGDERNLDNSRSVLIDKDLSDERSSIELSDQQKSDATSSRGVLVGHRSGQVKLPCPSGQNSSQHGRIKEDQQIAADLAALERYNEEFGDFLDGALGNEGTVIIEDSDSEASGRGDGLYGRRVNPSTPSAESSLTNQDVDEVLSEDIHTDDEFQDPLPTPVSYPAGTPEDSGNNRDATEIERNHSYERQGLHYNDVGDDDVAGNDDHDGARRGGQNSAHGRTFTRMMNNESSSNVLTDESNEHLHRRMKRYQELAGDIMEEANVSEEEELDDMDFKHQKNVAHSKDDHNETSNDLIYGKSITVLQNEQTPPIVIRTSQQPSIKTETVDADFVKIIEPTSRFPPPIPSAMEKSLDKCNDIVVHQNEENYTSHFQGTGHLAGDDGNKSNDTGTRSKCMDIANMRMDLCLEDRSGNSKEWRDVQIESSFYRSIPRGATIKLRPKTTLEQEEWRGQGEPEHPQLPVQYQGPGTTVALCNLGANSAVMTDPNEQMVPLSFLKRLEKEREVLMSTLEEIINERSMLAAQVKDMKLILPGSSSRSDGCRHSSQSTSGHDRHASSPKGDSLSSVYEDIDLGAELREAYSVMARLNDETDKTLAQMESRNQENLQRAYEAEEECILLKSRIYRLEAERSSQERRLTEAFAEQDRLRQLVDGTDGEIKTVRENFKKDVERIEQEARDKRQEDESHLKRMEKEVEQLQAELNEKHKQGHNEDFKASRKVSELEGQLQHQQRDTIRERHELNDRINRTEQLFRSVRDESDAERIRAGTLQNDVDRLNEEVRKWKNDYSRVVDDLGDMERKRAIAQRDLEETKQRMIAAEMEASSLRMRLEESMKQRLASLDDAGELKQVHASLAALRESTKVKEQTTQRQLFEFRNRAERAENAAFTAEQGAKEAANMAKLIQERAQAAILKEQEQIQKLEREKELLSSQLDPNKVVGASPSSSLAIADNSGASSSSSMASEAINIANTVAPKSPSGLSLLKSSSRKGLRRSSSRNRDAEKKKKEAKARASGSDRKRSGYRAMFFG